MQLTRKFTEIIRSKIRLISSHHCENLWIDLISNRSWKFKHQKEEFRMRKLILLAASIFSFALLASCRREADDFKPETIIGLERGALDRWGKGDPQGYIVVVRAGGDVLRSVPG